MPVLRVKLTAEVDTDNTKVTFTLPKSDAETLTSQIQDMIQFRGGLKGFSNPIIKTIAEGKVMGWVRNLIAKGWVDFIPDSKNWKIVLKRGE